LLGAVAAFAVLGLCPSARAHPHLLITVETTVLYDKGTFTGLRHKWTFDEMNSAAEVEGLDKNKDGIYERSELQELADLYVQRLKAASYFTYPKLAGQPLQFDAAKDQWVEYKNNAITLHFTVPFTTPVLIEAKGLTFSVSDPSFYIAFSMADSEQAVQFSEGTPARCKSKIGAADTPEASALQETMTAFGAFAFGLPKLVAVECDGP
jgi:ABC-type uncharacterized transport system substrate-binding protein